MESALEGRVRSEAGATRQANHIPRPTDVIGDCVRLLLPERSWAPRQDLGTVRVATPQLVVATRVLEGCHSPWHGKRRVEHGTTCEVRLQDRRFAEVTMVAILVFAVLVVVAKPCENFVNSQGREALDCFETG